MRTRSLKLLDYGITKEEADRLIELAGDPDNAALVKLAVDESNPGLSDALFTSLTMGIGYRRMMRQGRYIPGKEDDFYAYRRRALYIFKLLLKGRETENQVAVASH